MRLSQAAYVARKDLTVLHFPITSGCSFLNTRYAPFADSVPAAIDWRISRKTVSRPSSRWRVCFVLNCLSFSIDFAWSASKSKGILATLIVRAIYLDRKSSDSSKLFKMNSKSQRGITMYSDVGSLRRHIEASSSFDRPMSESQ